MVFYNVRQNKSRGGHIVATKDTRDIMPLIEEIFKHYGHVKDGDFMRELMELILNKLMEAEVTAKIGADKYERTEERNNQRNGIRIRPYDTHLGTIDLKKYLNFVRGPIFQVF